MKTLTIHRNKGWFGRYRALKIFVDEEEVAVLSAGETASVEVDDYAQFILGKMDWAKTDRLDLQSVGSGQSVNFDAYFTFNPLRGVGILPMPFRVSAS